MQADYILNFIFYIKFQDYISDCCRYHTVPKVAKKMIFITAILLTLSN